MPRRKDRLWALIGGFTFAVLLALASATPSVAGYRTGMSAPAAPRTSITSAPLEGLLCSHACGCGADAPRERFEFPAEISAGVEAGAERAESCRCYGPLFLRPPPSLS